MTASAPDGLRPMHIRTDLAPLADLLEIAFSHTMDSSGRSSLEEMRALSRFGLGLSVLTGWSPHALGVGVGYVWQADGKLVGNVSTFPANGASYMRDGWVIVNVAVHPDYRKRGIAQAMMEATMELIRKEHASAVYLQVDSDNLTAQRLYERLGFQRESRWVSWKRSGSRAAPLPFQSEQAVTITRPRAGDWQAEYRLASQLRPPERGGLGWLQPLHEGAFRRSWWQSGLDWLALGGLEKMVIRSADGQEVLATAWVESGFGSGGVKLTLLVQPDYVGLYDAALINTIARRWLNHSLHLEHPDDGTATSAVLRDYGFQSKRDVIHMRWDIA